MISAEVGGINGPGPPPGAAAPRPDLVRTPAPTAPRVPTGRNIPGAPGLLNAVVPGIFRYSVFHPPRGDHNLLQVCPSIRK